MAKKKPRALEALARVKDERAALESRAADLKRAAALEVGLVVLDAGGADLEPHHLRSLVSNACALGGEVAVGRLNSGGHSAAVMSAQVERATAEGGNSDG